MIKKIIPCLDVDKGRVVKGKNFKDITDVSDPIKLAKFYNEQGADELVFYDITASSEKRGIFLDLVKDIANEMDMPFTVGGGIREIRDFEKVLSAGADKVSINSAAVKNPGLINDAAMEFGSKYIVLSIDAKKGKGGSWTVYTNGGRSNTGMDVVEWAIRGEKLGAGEIIINSIDTDGVKSGYDIEIINLVCKSISIPVTASGGAGKMEDFLHVFKEGKASAALAASVFHYGEIKINELKKYLNENGINTRRRECGK